MTLPRIYRLMEYWKKHPPLHVMVQAYLGIKPQGAPPPDNASLGGLLAELGAAGIEINEVKDG